MGLLMSILLFFLVLNQVRCEEEQMQPIPAELIRALNKVTSTEELFMRYVRLPSDFTDSTTTEQPTTTRRPSRQRPGSGRAQPAVGRIQPALAGRLRPSPSGRRRPTITLRRDKVLTARRRTRVPTRTTPPSAAGGVMESSDIGGGSPDSLMPLAMQQMIAGMTNSATCGPRNQSVPISSVLPAKEHELFWPQCVLLPRCGGCCFEGQECGATRKTTVTTKVGRLIYRDDANGGAMVPVEFLEVELEKHLACECACAIKPEDCHPQRHIYLHNECRCKCKNENNKSKCPALGKVWDNHRCRCVCAQNPIPECDTDEEFKHDTCRCEAKRSQTEPLPMPGPDMEETCLQSAALATCMNRDCPGDARPQFVQYSPTSSNCSCRRRRRNRNRLSRN